MSITSTRPHHDVTNTETFIELIANVGHQTMILHNITIYTLYDRPCRTSLWIFSSDGFLKVRASFIPGCI